MNNTQHMRADEAAHYLGIGKSTLWLFVKQGKIRSIKLSGKVTIFKKSNLDEFVALQESVA